MAAGVTSFWLRFVLLVRYATAGTTVEEEPLLQGEKEQGWLKPS